MLRSQRQLRTRSSDWRSRVSRTAGSSRSRSCRNTSLTRIHLLQFHLLQFHLHQTKRQLINVPPAQDLLPIFQQLRPIILHPSAISRRRLCGFAARNGWHDGSVWVDCETIPYQIDHRTSRNQHSIGSRHCTDSMLKCRIEICCVAA